jgi:hypothetical protein
LASYIYRDTPSRALHVKQEFMLVFINSSLIIISRVFKPDTVINLIQDLVTGFDRVTRSSGLTLILFINQNNIVLVKKNS